MPATYKVVGGNNLLAKVADPVFIGFFKSTRAQAACKVIERLTLEEDAAGTLPGGSGPTFVELGPTLGGWPTSAEFATGSTSSIGQTWPQSTKFGPVMGRLELGSV